MPFSNHYHGFVSGSFGGGVQCLKLGGTSMFMASVTLTLFFSLALGAADKS